MRPRTSKPSRGTMTYMGFQWKPFFNLGGGGEALWLHGKPWISAETDPARRAAALQAISKR